MDPRKCLSALSAMLVLFAGCTSRHQPTSAGSESPTPSGSVSASASPSAVPLGKTSPPITSSGFVVVDSTWISDNSGWVLGGKGCDGSGCSILVKTTDGGLTWHRLNAPAAYVFAKGKFPQGTSIPDVISHIRFANSSVGYAFGSAFFMTTDGGGTWTKQGTREVASLEINRGVAVRVSYAGTGCPGPCDALVESATVGSAHWRRIFGPFDAGFGSSVAVQGPTIYLASFGHTAGGAGSAHTTFWRSSNLGASWTGFDDPCGQSGAIENDAADFIPTAYGSLIVECRSRGENADAFIVESSKGGATFGPRRTLPVVFADAVGAGSSSTIAVTYDANGLGVLVSHDAGRTWRSTLSVQRPPGSEQPGPLGDSKSIESFMGFEDSLTARASFGTAYLWTTRDGGDSWRRSTPFAGF